MTKSEYWLFIFPLFLLCFLVFVDHLLIVPLSAQISKATGFPLEQSGLLIAVYPLAAAFSAFVSAPFSDRLGRKTLLSFLCIGFILATLGFALSESAFSIFLFRILSGVFAGPVMPNALAFAGDTFAGKQRTEAITLIMLAFSVSSVLGVPLGAWISDYAQWQTPFYSIAIFGMLCLFALQRLPSVVTGAESGKIAKQYQEFLTLLQYQAVQKIFFIQFCMMVGLFGLVANLSVWLSLNYQFTATEIGLCYMQGGIGALIGNLLAGKLMRAGYKLSLLSLGSIFMGIFFIIGCFGIFPPDLMGVFFALMMLGASLRMPALQVLLTELVPISIRGRLMSMSMIVSNISIGLGSIWSIPFLTIDNGLLQGMERVGVIGGISLFSVALWVWLFQKQLQPIQIKT